MARALCSRCEARTVRTSVPNPPSEAAELLGLTFREYGRYACATCGQDYAREEESEYLDPDRVTWHFDMVGLSSQRKKEKAGATVVRLEGAEPSPPALPAPVVTPPAEPSLEVRCPKCGSTNAGRDGFLSDWDFDVFLCESCKHLEAFEVEVRSTWITPTHSPARGEGEG